MNTVIANIILDRIQNAGFEWVDKTAGLVRPITFVKGKTSRTLPIAANVSDPLNCTDDVIQALLPEEKYKSVLFIEGDQFPELVKSPIGDSYRSKLRIVVWLNCSKLGGGAGCGDFAAKAITELLQNPRKYDADPLKSIKHKVVGGLTRGKDIFGKYTLSEEKSMFLHFPFDFFSLDVETEYYAPAGCFDGLTEDQTACWTPGSDGRRLHPNQFTCEQLQDATHGLTAEQLGPNCLDCSGDGGDCDPLGYDLHNSEDTVLLSGVITDPCGKTLELTAPDATYDLKDADGNTLSSGSIPSQVNAVITAPSATVLRDGSPYGNVLSGGSIDVESDCPTPLDSTVQLKDSDGVDIGIPLEVPYNSTNLPITAPDATVKTTDGVTTVQAIKSNANGNLPQSVIRYKDSANASQVTAASDTEFASGSLRPATEVPRRELKNFGGTGLGQYVTVDRLIADTVPNVAIPLKFGWAAGNGDTLTWTVTTDEAGTYGTYTPTGTNGTITYSKNGGGYAALSGSITLAVSDTIIIRRTTTTSAGSVKWGA
jgi:hypothetical protein